MNYIKNNTVKEMKAETLFQLNNMPIDEISDLAKLLSDCKGNIYFTGIGKSENMAFHTCSIIKSVGIKCFNLNCNSSLHGDIGSLYEDDIIIFFSKSGNTSEIINLIPFIKSKGCLTIGICCDKRSKFLSSCDKTITLPLTKELEINEISSIPTNSCMSQLFFCNLLSSFIIQNRNISVLEYKTNHPAGNIGKNLKTIKDILIKNFPKINIDNIDCIKINDILLEMTKFKTGCCLFTNKNKLLGLLTDGDIRRLILNNKKDFIIVKNINSDFTYETDLNKFIYKIENFNIKKFIPIIQNDNLYGIIRYEDI